MSHTYRIFHLKPDGGIERAEHVWALDDVMALTTLRLLASDHGAELWDLARVVGKVAPKIAEAKTAANVSA